MCFKVPKARPDVKPPPPPPCGNASRSSKDEVNLPANPAVSKSAPRAVIPVTSPQIPSPGEDNSDSKVKQTTPPSHGGDMPSDDDSIY